VLGARRVAFGVFSIVWGRKSRVGFEAVRILAWDFAEWFSDCVSLVGIDGDWETGFGCM